MSIKLIEVTLRESFHVDNTPVTLENAGDLVAGLSRTGIDFIEIGYLGREGTEATLPPSIPRLPAITPMHYIEHLAGRIAPESSTKLVLMLHPAQFHPEMLPRMRHPAVGLVRLCIPVGAIDAAVPLIRELAALGIAVSANLVHASLTRRADMLAYARKAADAGATYMYLADSNGSMLPSDVREIYTALRSEVDIRLGIHAHDNLRLASTNTLEAMQAGVSMVDASIQGFGKGPGNVCTETFLTSLKLMGFDYADRWNLSELLRTANEAFDAIIAPVVDRTYFTNGEGVLTAFHDLKLESTKSLEKKAESEGTRLFQTLLAMEPRTVTHYTHSYL